MFLELVFKMDELRWAPSLRESWHRAVLLDHQQPEQLHL